MSNISFVPNRHSPLTTFPNTHKIKWIILEALLSALLTRVIKKIRETNPAVLKQITRRLFPTAFFFIVTCIIFTPSSLFLGNIDEFSIRYIDIVPILLCTAIGGFAIIFVFAFWLMQEKALPYYMAFIFSVTVAAYIQSNFLNASLPILDGALIQWEKYRTQNLISALVWILCFVFVFSSLCFKKRRRKSS